MQAAKSSQRSVLIIVMATSFLAPFMGNAINLAIPAIGSEFGGGPQQLSWIVSSYILASAAFLLPIGRLSDLLGRSRFYLVGISLFALFTLLSGLAWSLPVMILFRVCHGVASALIFSTGIAILTSAFPAERRGYVLGLASSATYLGLLLGPVLGGFMNHYAGWRSIFYFVAAISLIAAVISSLNLKAEPVDAKGQQFGWAGSALYVVALTSLLYGLSSLGQGPVGIACLAIGLVLMVAFVIGQKKSATPILSVALFTRNRVFAFSNLAALINYSATFAVAFVLSLYLQVVLHYDSSMAGLILLSQPVMMMLFSPYAGRLSDRHSARMIASAGMAITTLGLFACIFLSPDTPLWVFIADLTVIGFGFAFFISPNTNAIMSSVQNTSYGIASATLATMRMIGQAASMAIMTLLLSLNAVKASQLSDSADTIAASARTAFIVFTAICALGCLASLVRGRD